MMQLVADGGIPINIRPIALQPAPLGRTDFEISVVGSAAIGVGGAVRWQLVGNVMCSDACHILNERPHTVAEGGAIMTTAAARGEDNVVLRLGAPLQDLMARGQQHGPHSKRVRPLHDGEGAAVGGRR